MRTIIRATALLLLCANSVFAQRVGNQIVVTADTAHLKSQNDEVRSLPKWSILTVKEVNGEWFWVTYSGRDRTTKGWVKRSDVVLLKKSVDFINAELKRAPTAELFVIRSSIRTAMFDYDEAIADCDVAIRIDRQNATAYFNRGKAWFWKGEYEQAIADHNEAIRLDPKNALVYHSRGFVRECNGDWENNITDYAESIRLDPENAAVYHSRGYAWHCKHEFEKAVADYTKALQLDPKDADAYANRGSLWESRSEYEKAVADYTEAILLDPTPADIYECRGQARERMGDYEKAIADYAAAVRLDPVNAPSAATKLAFLLATCPDDKYRDGKRAVELATKACEDSRWANFDNIHALAAACAEVGDFANAIKWEEKVVSQVSKKEKAAYRFHLDLYKSGRPYRKSLSGESLLRSAGAKGCTPMSNGSDNDM